VLALPGFRDRRGDAGSSVNKDRHLAVRDDYPLDRQREEHSHRLAVRIKAAVPRQKRIDEDDLLIGLLAHHGHLFRPVLAWLPRWVRREPPRERTHLRSLRRRFRQCAGMSPERCREPRRVDHDLARGRVPQHERANGRRAAGDPNRETMRP
jgi:hypothetical protein